MPDLGERLTEADLQRLKAKIKEVYTQAYEDIYKKNLDFVRKHEKREAMYRRQLADGKISKADFDAWMRGQVFQGKQWEAKRKQMRETLLNADEVAMQMVNDSRYSVFATNANYIGYELEKGLGAMTSFGLYDANSVARLLKEEPDLLPPRKVGKDDSYKWYNRQIQTAITQGIIQGERIDEIAKRIAAKTGETNMKAMIRNARTMHTGAQNAGRMEGLHQAQRLGIKVKKRWMATLDGRTRDSHRSLDGQVQEVDDPFKSELGNIMFPGDAHAHPGNVWNCRCTITYVYPDYPDSMMRRDNETGEIIEDMDYKDWLQWKENGRLHTDTMRPEESETEPEVVTQHETVEEPAPIEELARPEIPEKAGVDGQDISMTWNRREDEYDFAIEDVVAAQGYDGLPTVVGAEEFDRLVKEANGGKGFIAQRTYSAPDRETLEAYRNELYHGKWYLECSGGSMFGNGMYCAADYTGTLSDGIEAEMKYYKSLHKTYDDSIDKLKERAKEVLRKRTIDQWVDWEDESLRPYLEAYDYDKGQWKDATIEQEISKLGKRDIERQKQINRALNRIKEQYDSGVEEIEEIDSPEYLDFAYGVSGKKSLMPSLTETMTLAKDAKIITTDELNDIRSYGYLEKHFVEQMDVTAKERKTLLRWIDSEEDVDKLPVSLREQGRLLADKADTLMEIDDGSFAAILGYDAINAEGQGRSGSYTVILNRTKVIIRRPT